MSPMLRLPLPLLAAAALLLALPAAAPAKKLTIKGAPAPGPSKYDKAWAYTYGSPKARTVLVLVPGTSGGAGSLAPVARDIARRAKGVQVWSFERREQAFEDTSGFEGTTLEEARSYYLGFKFRRTQGKDVPFVADWGFKTELNDLRRVIRKARAGGRRKVILGGHSRGASSAVAYAAWDFGGRAGYRDLDGLVLIDGGLGAFGSSDFTEAEARERLAEIRGGKVFNDPLGIGIPEIGQILSQLAARYAAEAPDAKSALQENPLIPSAFKPDFPVTNEAAFGYIFDKTTGPDAFASLRVRAGRLADSGDPRGWVDGENLPISRMAKTFAATDPNATEWYYPARLVLDTSGANALRRTPAADALGLRVWHAKRIDVPLYAIQTDLTNGGVLRGARTLVKRSRIEKPKLVDASRTMSHLDPVVASAERNRFLKTVEPWLERIARQR